jgi:choline dehydrogenase-like flavoprotein
MSDFDVCVIGSGAGGGAVAWRLAMAGRRVLVLEKGPWFKEADFFKDELACCRRTLYTPDLKDEQHVIEERTEGGWEGTPTSESGSDYWNGNMVGGSSNLMSGFFHRMKPIDFRLRSEFGPIAGANVADWPITYDDLEPYYAEVERVVGVSGRVVAHPFLEPRSTPDFPYPPTAEHPVAAWIDQACTTLGYRALPLPRAILSRPKWRGAPANTPTTAAAMAAPPGPRAAPAPPCWTRPWPRAGARCAPTARCSGWRATPKGG